MPNSVLLDDLLSLGPDPQPRAPEPYCGLAKERRSVFFVGCHRHCCRGLERAHSWDSELGSEDSSLSDASLCIQEEKQQPVEVADAFGWFEELEAEPQQQRQQQQGGEPIPQEVLEDSLETQALWYLTSGKRPRQPEDEREKFQLIYSMNNRRSRAGDVQDSCYQRRSLTSDGRGIQAYDAFDAYTGCGGRGAANIILRHTCGLTPVLPLFQRVRSFGGRVVGPGPASSDPVRRPAVLSKFGFGRSLEAAKSFKCASPYCTTISSVTLKLSTIRVLQKPEGAPFAQFLLVVSNDGMTFAVWRRFSHFRELSKKLQDEPVRFRKSLKYWQDVQRTKRWYRCLDRRYLARKGFLLQRFLYQVLADSSRLDLIEDFVCEE